MTEKTKPTTPSLSSSTDFSHTKKVEKELIVTGQGVVAVSAITDCELNFLEYCFGEGKRAMKLSVTSISTTIQGLDDSGDWVILTASHHGIDRDPHCQYWLSIDGNNAVVRYGKGEIRGNTVLLEYAYDKMSNIYVPAILIVKWKAGSNT